MMSRLIKLSVFLLAGVVGSVSAAENIYVQGNLGHSVVKEKFSGAGVRSTDDSGTAWNANLGYQLSDNFAVEGGYTNYAQVVAPTAGGKVKDQLKAWNVAGKAIAPLNDQFNVYAKLGVARVSSRMRITDPSILSVGGRPDKDKEYATTLLAGVGGEYMLTDDLGLDVQWTTTARRRDIPRTHFVSAGLTYKFDLQ